MGLFSPIQAAVETLILCGRPSRVSQSGGPTIDRASLFERIYFMWANSLLARAARGTSPIQLGDLWECHNDISIQDAREELTRFWMAEKDSSAAAGTAPSLKGTMWRLVRRRIAIVWGFKMGWLLFAMCSNAVLLAFLIRFLQTPSEPVWIGYVLALAFLVSEAFRSVCVNQHWLVAVLAGIRLRAAARGLLYSKLLLLRADALESTGPAVNLLTGDAQRLCDACSYGEFILSTGPTLLTTMAIMLALLGPAALAGFAVLLLFVPVQAHVGSLVGGVRAKAVKFTDARAKLMAEILANVKSVKLNGWEAPLAERVAAVRSKETSMLTRGSLLRAVNTVIVFCVPALVTLAAFSAYVLASGQAIGPIPTFVVLSLFNVARFCLGLLPQAVRNVQEAVVAATRMQAFLRLPEVEADDCPVQLPSAAATDKLVSSTLAERTGDGNLPPDDVVIFARNASFMWPVQANPAAVPKSAPVAVALSRRDGAVGASTRLFGVTRAPVSTPTAAVPVAGDAVRIAVPDTSSSVAAGDRAGLHNLNFSIRKGQVCVVIGPVGSGKSSLLSAALGHLKRTEGTIALRGSIAYAAQTPWIFNSSIKKNILFNRAFDDRLYTDVVFACALNTDFLSLPSGDETEIGEKGINLSGGQKARVALARALYATDAKVLLLDDPLSAVDSKTGRHLWTHAILDVARRGGRTVLLVTHQLQYLSGADVIIEMAPGGSIAAAGSYAELIAAERFLDVRLGLMDEEPEAQVERSGEETVPAPVATAAAAPAISYLASATAAPVTADSVAVAAPTILSASAPADSLPPPASSPPLLLAAKPPSPTAALSSRTLIIAEDRTVGAVSLSTLLVYMRAGGGDLVPVGVLAILVIAKGALLVSNWWLAFWTQHGAGASAALNDWYLGIYAALVAATIVFTLVQGASFGIFTIGASRKLHDAVFASILRATPAWFDSQPLGRILARFTGDVDSLDTLLPPSLEQSSEYLTQVFLGLIIICVFLPWFAAALLPVIGFFLCTSVFFKRAARELKRLDSISRSPLVSCVSSTLGGLHTIRAFGEQSYYARAFDSAANDSTRTYWAFYASNRWVAIRLDWCTTVVAFIVAILCVTSRDTLPPGIGGFVLSQGLMMAGILQFATRLTSECEANLTSVERLTHYAGDAVPHEQETVILSPHHLEKGGSAIFAASKAPDEDVAAVAEFDAAVATIELDAAAAPIKVSVMSTLVVAPQSACCTRKGIRLPQYAFPGWYSSSWNRSLVAADWPRHGAIEFDRVFMRYRADLPPVLSDLSFAAQAGQTVVVVGRTGAGKSSILNALFRMCECDAGKITIDGVDISRVNLYHLRSRLAIIPQDPMLFSGSLRSNVDVFDAFSDDEVMRALTSAGLQQFTRGHAQGLLRPMAEGGSTISTGERQLVCLARALLRKSRIVCLDEATASTDGETEKLIQHSVKVDLQGSTLMIIAHRLQAAVDADRVLVVDAGRAVEFDTPAALLGLGPRLESSSSSSSGRLTDAKTQSEGYFASMVRNTGVEMEGKLRAIALDNEEKRRLRSMRTHTCVDKRRPAS